MINLSAAIDFHARTRPSSPALVYAGRRINYLALSQASAALAGLMAARGVQPGDRVAVLMKNSALFIELAIATSRAGAVFLPINFRLAPDEVAYILADAEAKLVFVDEEFADKVSFDQAIMVPPSAQSDPSGLVVGAPPLVEAAPRATEDLLRLMYTSGTTDRPKGVMHTYSNFYWKCIDHVIALDITAQDRLLVVGPLYHVGAFDLPGVAVLWKGGLLCVHRDFVAEAAARAIEEERITGVWLAPVMLNAMLEDPEARRRDLSSLRWCVGGGERTPESRIRQAAELFPQARYVDAYGLTETCSGDTLMEAGREIEKIGSVGRPTPHVRVAILDEDNAPLSPMQEGEICVSGPKVTQGYWRAPEKTRSTIRQGWLRTGDVGYLDEEGFLYITDRRKDMIISGGENIASSEVERVIYQLPQVSEAAVIGVPDDKWGERPVAVVVLKRDAQIGEAEIVSYCRAHLAAFKAPKGVVFRDALPRNSSGKVLKRTLRDELSRVETAP